MKMVASWHQGSLMISDCFASQIEMLWCESAKQSKMSVGIFSKLFPNPMHLANVREQLLDLQLGLCGVWSSEKKRKTCDKIAQKSPVD